MIQYSRSYNLDSVTKYDEDVVIKLKDGETISTNLILYPDEDEAQNNIVSHLSFRQLNNELKFNLTTGTEQFTSELKRGLTTGECPNDEVAEENCNLPCIWVKTKDALCEGYINCLMYDNYDQCNSDSSYYWVSENGKCSVEESIDITDGNCTEESTSELTSGLSTAIEQSTSGLSTATEENSADEIIETSTDEINENSTEEKEGTTVKQMKLQLMKRKEQQMLMNLLKEPKQLSLQLMLLRNLKLI